MESRVRAGGVVLLALGLVVTQYVPTWWLRLLPPGSMPNDQALFAVLAVGGSVLIPLGAGFLAVSVVLRGLVRPQGASFIAWQLVAGIVLVVAGLCTRVWGGPVSNDIADFLGPTGQAGIEVTAFVLAVLQQLAIPVGVALVAVVPLQVALRGRPAAA